ncbi:MAG TPA: hypothetical protein VM870_05100, partial [Pyrinomonadaceae bacterium]|nr:hypothetical protein [Pyrinomonadaceae bacterium]
MINAIKADLSINSTFPSERLSQYLAQRGDEEGAFAVEALTPDASTRLYFRIPWPAAPGGTAVAAVYPEAFDPEVNPFLDLSRLLTEARIPIPEIYAVDGPRGLILQEDLGDQQLVGLLPQVTAERRTQYLEKAVAIIADIQGA